jgi:hypothetical protein
MACMRCGCRLLARATPRSSQLLCADCGAAQPGISPVERRNGWLGIAAITAALLITTAMVIVAGLNQEGPTLAERQQQARVSEAGAGE